MHFACCVVVHYIFESIVLNKTKSVDDNVIIKGCIEGEPYFQKMLVKRYSGQLMTVSRRYARSYEEAQDILQEALIKVFSNIHKFDSTRASLKTWMKKILVNTALNYIEKAHNKKQSVSLDVLLNPPEVAPSVFSYLTEEEILDLIQELPTRYRMVFNLHVMEGYSHREIAEALGIKESSSRSNYMRARNILQNLIEKNFKLHHG